MIIKVNSIDYTKYPLLTAMSINTIRASNNYAPTLRLIRGLSELPIVPTHPNEVLNIPHKNTFLSSAVLHVQAFTLKLILRCKVWKSKQTDKSKYNFINKL